MARSFTNAKLISALIAEKISIVASRRGYAAASQGAVRGGGGGPRRSNMNMTTMKKGGGGGEESTKTNSWVPDPVTGYYRPETHANEIDAAELRNMLLKHKN